MTGPEVNGPKGAKVVPMPATTYTDPEDFDLANAEADAAYDEMMAEAEAEAAELAEAECDAYQGGVQEDDAPDCGHDSCWQRWVDARADAWADYSNARTRAWL